MKILVTGGAGFIGSNLSLELEKKGHTITILDDFSSGTNTNLSNFQGTVIQQNLADLSYQKLLKLSPDAIFHQAAITDTTVYDEKLMLAVNVSPMTPLLRYVEEKKKPLIYASSAAVYGSAPSPQYEADAGKPLNIYGVSKWQCDCLVTDFLKKNPKSHVVGLRYFNVYGPREQNKGKMASMIYQLAMQIMAGNKPRLFKWGQQKRDFVYVRDVVTANILALEKGASGIFNVGSGKARSFNEVCSALFEALGTKTEIEYFDNPYFGKYQDHTEASLDRTRTALGYKSEWDLKAAVKDYARFLNTLPGAKN